MNPLVRINIPCGTDQNISVGREPCQGGWYEWAGSKFCVNKTVLDVGAGMCDGMKILEKTGAKLVYGQDIDSRLKHLTPNLIIGDLLDISEKSYDIVTCFDVIEHVIEDKIFFKMMARIAKELIIITTPNFSRSKAQNLCHCREYTIPQFVNYFSPNELWVASPDGKIHHTLLLKKNELNYIDVTRNNYIYLNNTIPLDTSFAHSSVDKQEWPHMCGIFNLLKY